MKDEVKTPKGSTSNKVKKLQKQYNKILVDLFDQYASESIEEALDKNDGAFGENICSIVQCALDCLKVKVLDELGVSDESEGIMDVEIDGIELPDEGSFQSVFSGEAVPQLDADDSEKDEEDEEDGEVDESTISTASTREYYNANESVQADKQLSSSRRGDQVMLSEAYTRMYVK